MIRKFILAAVLLIAGIAGIPSVAGAEPMPGTGAGGWVLGDTCTYHTNVDHNSNGTSHYNIDAYQRSDRPFTGACNDGTGKRGNVMESTSLWSQMGASVRAGNFPGEGGTWVVMCPTGVNGANDIKFKHGVSNWTSLTGARWSSVKNPAYKAITGYMEPGHIEYYYSNPTESGHLLWRDAVTLRSTPVTNCATAKLL